MKTKSTYTRKLAGFTLTELIVAGGISTLVLAFTMTFFISSLRSLNQTTRRLQLNSTMRNELARIAKSTMEADAVYLFTSINDLDDTVTITTDPATGDQLGVDMAGDCLVLVYRSSHRADSFANITGVRVFYRDTTIATNEANLRYYETYYKDTSTQQTTEPDYAASTTTGSTDSVSTILSRIKLKTSPAQGKIVGKRVLGIPLTTGGTRQPIFYVGNINSGGSASTVAVNAEFRSSTNDTTVNGKFAATTLNFVISPRK